MKSKTELIADALRTCADQYTNYSTRYAALDAKAQGTAAIAGVLLGAVLAFVPQAIFRLTMSFYGHDGAKPVQAVLAFSVAAIGFSLRSLQVRPGRIPYCGEAVAKGALDLAALADNDRPDDLVEIHYRRQLAEW